ncbi:MAG TPA: hypothetical protein VN260_10975, partial [Dissulfurispiraceae bacterium]|nr:hypothetical protein [Dissulfurispiraceae bacterium]
MKKPARWAIIAAVVVIVGAVLALSGGLPLPRSTADIVLPELEKMTGQRFSAGRMSLSIVPLFVEARDIKAVDGGGNTILAAESVKAYAALSGLVNREITLRRLVIRKPCIDVTRPVLEEIIGHVKAYLREEKETPFKVVIKSIDLSGADLSVSDASSKAAASGLSAQIILGKEPRVRLSTKDIALFRDGMPEFHGMVDTYLVVDEKNINVRNLKVLAHQTTVSTTGSLGKDDFAGQLQVEIDFFMETLKRFFGLKGPGDGRLTAKGSVKIDQIRDGLKGIILDLAVKGDFYLETLMETLKVTEPLSGSLSVDGKITGRLNDPVGEGTAVLKKGNLYTVDVDHLTCNVTYREGTMKFEKGKARLYNGSAEAEASIRLPVVDTFTLRVAVRDVDSKGIFKLINWDPGIPDGKVTGELYSSGHDFSPEGRFTYAGRTKGRDILGRVAAVSGDFSYRMSDELIRFPRLTVASEKSQLAGEGSVNLKASSLSFTANGTSQDVADFSAPYFTALSGPASFSLSVEGPLADPLLSARFQGRSMVFMTGKLDMRDVLLDKSYAFDAFDGSVSYRRNLLKVDQAIASVGKEEYRATGTVSFPEAKTLFDVAKPDYNLTIAFRNANIAAVASAFDGGPALSGAADGEFRFTGRPAALKTAGNMRALKFAYGDALTTSEASAHVRYDARKFVFSDLRLVKGRSTLAGQGTISLDQTFSFAVEGGTVDVADLVPARSMDRLKDSPVSALGFSNVRIRGQGTFADPVVDASADLRDWRYQGRSLGKGGVSASLRGKHLEGSGHLLDGKVRVKGEAELTDELPWTAFVEMQSARYDFLVEGMLKDAPEDLLINLNGTIRANGNRNHLKAVARIDRVHLTLYGNAFTNSAPVALRIEDRKLFVDNFGLRSDTTEFAVTGTTTMGKQFDLHFEGSSSLAPIRA